MRVAIVTGVLLGACYRDAPPAAPAPAEAPAQRVRVSIDDPLGYLPIDSELVAHLDARQLRASPAWQRFEPTLLARIGPIATTFRQTCGFDPLAAIQTISIGMKHLDADQPSGVLVVRGLDRKATMSCYQRAAAQRQQPAHVIDRGVVVIPGAPGEPSVAFAFADARTAVLMTGHEASVPSMLDILESGIPLRGSPAFADLIARLELRDALWFVMNGNSKLMDRMSSTGMKPRALFGSFDLQTGLTGALTMRLDAPDQATQIVNMVQPQLGAVQAFVERIEVTAEDADVVLRFAMTQQQLETMASMLGGALGTP